jgi:hypothetical protein
MEAVTERPAVDLAGADRLVLMDALFAAGFHVAVDERRGIIFATNRYGARAGIDGGVVRHHAGDELIVREIEDAYAAEVERRAKAGGEGRTIFGN